MLQQLAPTLPAAFRATFEGLPFIVTMHHAPDGRLRVAADVEGSPVGVEVHLDVTTTAPDVLRRAAVKAVASEAEHYKASLLANA